ncbi:MAG: sn-glycerol-1-phosphate dehydrogenase [Oscillospiraceae bacterium]|nr:sn-glycerol-1-phosphate dehydrogenase [Oscillospiraceae bacterium]
MDFVKMLKEFDCDCGKRHNCAIRHIHIGKGALQELPGTVKNYSDILLVADPNTYGVCGEAVEELLGEKRYETLILVRDGVLIPNEQAIAEVEAKLTDKTDLIVGVGSGVIQDLCKYVSFYHKLPYAIVCTAPSMDGYAGAGAAMITDNMKITYSCHVPETIIGDVDVLKTAPMDMIRAGYGDILGKYSCLNDWKLSAVVRGEDFCQYVYDLIYDMLLQTKDLGEKLQQRDEEAIITLMEAIIGVGIAMAYVGSSRPASGSEHHLSHYFEITGILNDEPYFAHGTDVVYSTVYTQMLREQLLALEAPTPKGGHDAAEWEAKIRAIYTEAAEGVLAQQDKMGWYREDRAPIYAAKWDEIRKTLAEVPSCEVLKDYIASVGLDIKEFTELYSAEKIENALWYAKDLKDRYSVLWLYYDLMR